MDAWEVYGFLLGRRVFSGDMVVRGESRWWFRRWNGEMIQVEVHIFLEAVSLGMELGRGETVRWCNPTPFGQHKRVVHYIVRFHKKKLQVGVWGGHFKKKVRFRIVLSGFLLPATSVCLRQFQFLKSLPPKNHERYISTIACHILPRCLNNQVVILADIKNKPLVDQACPVVVRRFARCMSHMYPY